MTDTVRVPRELVQFLLGEAEMDGLWFGDAPRYVKGDARYGQFWWRHDLRAMLAASPQGEGDCVCVRRGDGPEGCGLCNETGVVTEGVKP